VLTTLKYFRNEYEEHVRNRRCPAGVCKELISYYIDPELCQACLICMRHCPAESIQGAKHTIHVIDQEACTKCGTCLLDCPPRFGAVRVISGELVPSPIPMEDRVLARAIGKG
jgi:NADH-quinone oxidoreductase subunit F